MNIDSFERFKPLKLCFKNEIHRVSKLPANYQALVDFVLVAFKSDLPSAWALQYEDADGDRIMLTSEEDYRSMLECEAEGGSRSTKVFLIPIEDRNNKAINTGRLQLSDISKSESLIVPQASESRGSDESQEQTVIIDKQNASEGQTQETREEEPKQEEQEEQEEQETSEEEQREVEEDQPEVKDEANESEISQVSSEKNEAQPHFTPVVLANNVKDTSAYLDIAFDFTNPKNQTQVQVPAESSISKVSESEGQKSTGEAQVLSNLSAKDSEKSLSESEQHRISQKLTSKLRQHRRQRMRGVVTDVLYENIPTIAELIKDYLQSPTSFNLEQLSKKTKRQESIKQEEAVEKPVHRRIICDGCGANPVVGVRYKCAICEDLDYCEKCEATIEHPHPFLKIKDPKHHPKAIITILEEDLPEPEQKEDASQNFVGVKLGEMISKIGNISKETKEQMKKSIGEISDKFFKHAPQKSVEEVEKIKEVELSEPVVEEEVPLIAEIPIEKEVHAFDVAFVKEICTIPSRITVNDKTIYKTVSLKNTGKSEWPRTCMIRNVSGVKGQEVKTVQLAPGKDFSCILILENPCQAGDFSSLWRLAYHDDQGNVQYSGESFEVGFTVVDLNLSRASMSSIDVQPVSNKQEEPKIKSSKYTEKMYKLAEQVKDIIPDVDMNDLLEVIKASPDINLETLLDQYLN